MSEPGQIRRRSIAIVFSDGGFLTVTTAGPADAAGHDEERMATVVCDPDGGPIEVAETLLSTEYGPDGIQRRATLELWMDGDEGQPLRGAGTLISATQIERENLRSNLAFFRWSVEGRDGLGHYEIVLDG